MFVAVKRIIHHQREGESDQLPIIFHPHLPLRESSPQPQKLRLCPARIDNGIQPLRDVSHGRSIVGLGAAWHEPEFTAYG